MQRIATKMQDAEGRCQALSLRPKKCLAPGYLLEDEDIAFAAAVSSLFEHKDITIGAAVSSLFEHKDITIGADIFENLRPDRDAHFAEVGLAQQHHHRA